MQPDNTSIPQHAMSIQEDNRALVLPSSVYVNAPNTILTNPEERERQYLDAILFYLRESPLQKIIVCDNSGYSYPDYLYKLALGHRKEIELLSFTGNYELIKEQGKGYGEGEIMEYIMANSVLIRQVHGFLKVTGRLKVVNMRRLLNSCKTLENYFMPVSWIRPRILVPRAARDCLEVRVYYSTVQFFREVLLKAYTGVSDEKIFFLEHAYHKAIATSPFTVKCFPVPPEITGISGSNGWTFRERNILQKALAMLGYRMGYVKPINYT